MENIIRLKALHEFGHFSFRFTLVLAQLLTHYKTLQLILMEPNMNSNVVQLKLPQITISKYIYYSAEHTDNNINTVILLYSFMQ